VPLKELSTLQDGINEIWPAKLWFACGPVFHSKTALPSSLGFQENRERYLNKITEDLSLSRQRRLLTASLPSEHGKCKFYSQHYSVIPV